MNDLVNDFLRYVKVDTTSSTTTNTHPSTNHQFDLANMLVNELKDLDAKDVYLSDKCYVYATIPSNSKDKKDTIGFMAHLDTAPDASGKDVKPRIIENYDGSDIILNKDLDVSMKVKDFPVLSTMIGRSLIVTDGTTLLGADDKAGIAVIMAMIRTLKENKDIIHGGIKILFTPDEEIGEGADNIDLERFKCDYAYTVDGDDEATINYENFNAASCVVTIKGKNIHPGSAKNKMVNSISIANEFDSMLPKLARPEYTEMYEGFNHLNEINGSVEETTMHYIIRNHDMKKFEEQKKDFYNIQNTLNEKYDYNLCDVNITDSYYNMREIVEKKMEVVDKARKAIEDAGMTSLVEPIRGGTDGARLTYDGIVCPNIGAGGHNFHGKYEFISIEGMMFALNVLLNIIKSA